MKKYWYFAFDRHAGGYIFWSYCSTPDDIEEDNAGSIYYGPFDNYDLTKTALKKEIRATAYYFLERINRKKVTFEKKEKSE
jgi:hypothetical protein